MRSKRVVGANWETKLNRRCKMKGKFKTLGGLLGILGILAAVACSTTAATGVDGRAESVQVSADEELEPNRRPAPRVMELVGDDGSGPVSLTVSIEPAPELPDSPSEASGVFSAPRGQQHLRRHRGDRAGRRGQASGRRSARAVRDAQPQRAGRRGRGDARYHPLSR